MSEQTLLEKIDENEKHFKTNDDRAGKRLQLFREALDVKNYEAVEYMLNLPNNEGLFYCDNEGNNEVHIAALRGDTTALNLFSKYVPGLLGNQNSSLKATPVHLAAYSKNREALNFLISEPSDLNAYDSDGQTPLHYATRVTPRDAEAVLTLKKQPREFEKFSSEEIEKTYKDMRAKTLDVVKTLVQNGADINIPDKSGCTPIYFAAKNGLFNVFIYLAENGAQIGEKNPTKKSVKMRTGAGNTQNKIFSEITKPKNGAMLNYLINSNERNHILDDNLPEILFAAHKAKATEALHQLVEQDDKTKAVEKYGSLLMGFACSLDDVELANKLIAKQVALGTTDNVLMAAASDSVRILKLMSENQVDFGVKDEYGNTPVHHAAKNNQSNALKFLKEQGLDLMAQNNSSATPAHLAASHDSVEALKFLASNSVQLNIVNSEGNTPAHLAAAHDNVKSFKFLCEAGADMNALNCQYLTPENVAKTEKSSKVLRFLKETLSKKSYMHSVQSNGR